MESQKHDHAKMLECKFRYARKCYKRGLHKYSSFPWFLNPNITYIFYRAKLHKSGLYHNFWLDCTSDLNWVFLNCILIALFRDTPPAKFFLWCATWQVHCVTPENAVYELLIQVASALRSKAMVQTWFKQLHLMNSALHTSYLSVLVHHHII